MEKLPSRRSKENKLWEQENRKRMAENQKINAAREKKIAEEKELYLDALEAKINAGTASDAEKEQYQKARPKKSLHEELNAQYYKNGEFKPPQASFGQEAPSWLEHAPNKTAQQIELMKYLQSTAQKELPDLINQMKQPISMDIFNHMNNPILQKMVNPQVLFPSQMQNQMYPGLESLLGQLGQQGMQYAINKAPDVWDYFQQNAPAVYQGAKNFGGQTLQYGQQAGSGIMDLLSNLSNRFRGPQQ